MRPREVFEVCHERYVDYRDHHAGKITVINPAACAKGQPKAGLPRAAEFMADFEKLGKRALRRRKHWRGRLELFVIYYCKGLAYKQALKLLKLKAGTFDWWAQEIKKTAGEEFRREGLYPPRQYFQEPHSFRAQREEEERNEN